MKGKNILLLGLGAAALFIWTGFNDAVDTAKGLRLYVTKFSLPKMEGGLIAVPVTVSIDNNSPSSVPVQSMLVTVERLINGTWTYIASSRPDLTNLNIKAHATTNVNVEVRSSPLDAIKELFNLATNFGQNKYKVKVETRIAGVIIPTEKEFTV
jgi:hypothetical protein